MAIKSREQGHVSNSSKSLGVGAKLRIAFFCVSAFAIAAAVVGVLALSSIEKRRNQVAEKAISTVIDAQSFAETISDLENVAVALSSAGSTAELDAEAGALADKAKSVLASLDRFEQRQFAEAQVEALRPLLDVLLANLPLQIELTRQHLGFEAQELKAKQVVKSATEAILETIKPMVIDAYADLLDHSDQLRATLSGQGPIDYNAALQMFDELTEVDIYQTERLGDLGFRIESLNSVIDRVVLENDPDNIRILNRDFNLDLRSLTRLALELPPSPAKDQIGFHVNQLHRIGDGARSVFNVRLNHVITDSDIVALDVSSRNVAAQIDIHVANIVAAGETAIDAATANARQSIAFGQLMLILIAVGAFGVAIIIGWTYVSNNIVRRINSLAHAMEGLAAGKLDISVSDTGTDELSEMAGALAVFKSNAVQIRRQDRALKQSEQRFALAVQGASVGIWDWEDVSNDREYWSPLFYSLLGYEVGEITPSLSGFQSLLHPDDRERTFDAVNAHLKEKRPYDIEVRLKHKSGEYRWFQATGQALWNENGEPIRMTGSISDITERRRIADLMEHQAEDLRRSNAELEQFAYVASHDLQEPLRMVSSYCELLRRRYGEKLDDDANEFIRFAVDGASRMQSLVRDLLQVSRIGRVELNSEPTDLAALASDVVSDISALVAETNAEVIISDLPTVSVDTGLMRVVLQNLIQNGIKFRADRRPVVRVTGRRVEEKIEISIADNGIGIEPQYADRIFEIFQRLHTQSEYPGTGIGLALAKRIVQRHEGEIWLDSAAKQGSTFRFTIPGGAKHMRTDSIHDRSKHLVG